MFKYAGAGDLFKDLWGKTTRDTLHLSPELFAPSV